MIDAEAITNAISKLLLEDTDIQDYCDEKFSKALIGEDNLIVAPGLSERPSFTVVKLPEEHFFNREQNEENGESSWEIGISFFGDFKKIQINNDTFEIPDGTLETINGVPTYTPSDIMRILARKAANLVYKKIGCQVDGVLVSRAVVDAEDYYDATNGEVKSFLQLSLYKKFTLYS